LLREDLTGAASRSFDLRRIPKFDLYEKTILFLTNRRTRGEQYRLPPPVPPSLPLSDEDGIEKGEVQLTSGGREEALQIAL
jgi:hypothetical protein